MNPTTAQARVIVDELVRCGVPHVVLCPGSRNAPLSMALFEAAAAGRLTMHVRIDERAAGFLALGLSRGAARPAAVVCTSGTAAANLHPAVLEASHSGVGMLAITADRPPELLGVGANQAIDQRGLYGPAAGSVEFPVAERRVGQGAVWRALVCRAVAEAEYGRPVQVNVPFREPLVPAFEQPWPDSLDGRPDGRRWTVSAAPPLPRGGMDFPLPARTLMVLGSGRSDRAVAAASVAESARWPVLAEPTARAAALSGGAIVLRHGSLLVSGELPEALRPDAVVVVGRPTLSRGVARLLSQTTVYAVGDVPGWVDARHVVSQARCWLDVGDLALIEGIDAEWLPSWRQADVSAQTAVEKLLGEQEWPTGLQVAAELVDALPSGANLFLGSSNPARDVDLVASPRADLALFANRGVSGIDGNVSTAAGVALASGAPSYAFVGDVTFLHDLNALVIGPSELRPELTVVVHNDDGGGIFSLLEQGATEYRASFERVFGTPHGVDLAAVCAALNVPHVLVGDRASLRSAVAPASGLRVVEIRSDRALLRDLHARLRAIAAEAVLS